MGVGEAITHSSAWFTEYGSQASVQRIRFFILKIIEHLFTWDKLIERLTIKKQLKIVPVLFKGQLKEAFLIGPLIKRRKASEYDRM